MITYIIIAYIVGCIVSYMKLLGVSEADLEGDYLETRSRENFVVVTLMSWLGFIILVILQLWDTGFRLTLKYFLRISIVKLRILTNIKFVKEQKQIL